MKIARRTGCLAAGVMAALAVSGCSVTSPLSTQATNEDTGAHSVPNPTSKGDHSPVGVVKAFNAAMRDDHPRKACSMVTTGGAPEMVQTLVSMHLAGRHAACVDAVKDTEPAIPDEDTAVSFRIDETDARHVTVIANVDPLSPRSEDSLTARYDTVRQPDGTWKIIGSP